MVCSCDVDFAGVGSDAGVKKLRFSSLRLKRSRNPRGAFLGEEKPLWNGLSTSLCACQTCILDFKLDPSVHKLKHMLAGSASDEHGKCMVRDDDDDDDKMTIVSASR